MLILIVLIISMLSPLEMFVPEYVTCNECGRRVQFAQVYADPNNLGGMGWVL